MNRPLSALIIGCGYVGSRLKVFLEGKGWEVCGARRTLQSGNHNIVIDVASEFTLSGQYDVIFYMVSAGAYTPKAYETAYVLGVSNTLRAIGKSGQRPRIIYVSSTSVFSETDGGWVTEESPTELPSFSTEALLQGERKIASSRLEYSILRLSGIYGPGRSHLIDQIKSRRAFLKKEPYISNRIHIEDCVGILHHIAILPHPEQFYIGTDSEPTPYNEVLTWLANTLHLDEIATEGEASNSAHMSNKRCRNAALIRSGYVFRYPNFREGLLSCL